MFLIRQFILAILVVLYLGSGHSVVSLRELTLFLSLSLCCVKMIPLNMAKHLLQTPFGYSALYNKQIQYSITLTILCMKRSIEIIIKFDIIYRNLNRNLTNIFKLNEILSAEEMSTKPSKCHFSKFCVFWVENNDTTRNFL